MPTNDEPTTVVPAQAQAVQELPAAARAVTEAPKPMDPAPEAGPEVQERAAAVQAAACAAKKAARIVPMVGASEFRAVSRREAAALLSVSYKTVERLVLRGQLPAFKVLGQWRILVSDLHAFIRKQRDAAIILKNEA